MARCPVPFTDTKGYIALLAIIANLVVSVVLTFAFRAMGVDEGVDQTKDDDYWADEGDEGVELEDRPAQGAALLIVAWGGFEASSLALLATTLNHRTFGG